MMTDAEITALKERVTLGDVWWKAPNSGECTNVRAIETNNCYPSGEPDPVAILADRRVVPLRVTTLSSFVTLQPCLSMDDYPDNLALLQRAARSGLDVDFMTGDIRVPKHLQPHA